MTPRRVRLDVAGEAAGERLDAFLASRVPALTRSGWKRLIEARHVTVDGCAQAKAGFVVKPGMTVATTLPEPEKTTLTGETIPIEVVHEDEHLAVIMKPAGLVVHPGHGNRTGTVVHALIGRGMQLAEAGGALRPGIVHRLDKETSGLMIVAKSDAAHRALAAMFARREIRKTYQALVWGRPSPVSGRIDDAIGRSRGDRTKMAVRAPHARAATTLYRTIEALSGFTLLEIELVTGRTHQIRVHFASRKHPVIGDTRYGGAPWKALRDPERRAVVSSFTRLALHAFRLAFDHPVTGLPLRLEAPIPLEFAALLSTLRAAA